MTSSYIAYTMTSTMALYINVVNEKNEKSKEIIELFDWMVNKKHLRGSKLNDNGIWMHTSSKPKTFCQLSRVIELEDGTKFLIKRTTACKALGLDKASELALVELTNRT